MDTHRRETIPFRGQKYSRDVALNLEHVVLRRRLVAWRVGVSNTDQNLPLFLNGLPTERGRHTVIDEIAALFEDQTLCQAFVAHARSAIKA